MMPSVTSDPSALRPSAAPGLPLAHLLPGASGVLTGVAFDSRAVAPGDLYVGLPGARAHGASFAAQAAAAGALAVLTDAAGAALAEPAGLPVLVVDDPRAAMAPLAADVYGRPGEALDLFAVTGTNGKTSTVFLLEAALAALGRTVATIGTIGFRVAGQPLDVARTTVTTPEAPDLQALLAVLRERGADTVAMEVSSHALALHRADALTFDAAGFTMLGQDHLEFHHTLEEYFAAKARLFVDGRTRAAVVNTDDPWGRQLLDSMILLIKEELHHFTQVREMMLARDIPYVKITASNYARGLRREVRSHEPVMLIDKLICGAYIEARSCERFAALAPWLDDDLQKFYLSLLRSEARHYQDYLDLAQKIAGEDISERVRQLGEAEAALILRPEAEFRFHSGVPAAA